MLTNTNNNNISIFNLIFPTSTNRWSMLEQSPYERISCIKQKRGREKKKKGRINSSWTRGITITRYRAPTGSFHREQFFHASPHADNPISRFIRISLWYEQAIRGSALLRAIWWRAIYYKESSRGVYIAKSAGSAPCLKI